MIGHANVTHEHVWPEIIEQVQRLDRGGRERDLGAAFGKHPLDEPAGVRLVIHDQHADPREVAAIAIEVGRIVVLRPGLLAL